MRQRDLDKYNRESDQKWRRQFEYVLAKVGTVPMNVWIDKETARGVPKLQPPLRLPKQRRVYE